MASHLAYLFEHNRWANLSLIDACKDLTDAKLDTTVPGCMGTVRELLNHIVGAETRYASRLSGGAFQGRSLERDALSLVGLRELAQQTGTALLELAQTTPDDKVFETQYQGETHHIRASVIVGQVINHGTDHRSQINTILTQCGVEAPDLQSWAFDAASKAG